MSISRSASPAQPRVPATLQEAWIAEAAYYRAERRGFQGGCPIEDWLAAEREISALPSTVNPVSPRVALVFLESGASGQA